MKGFLVIMIIILTIIALAFIIGLIRKRFFRYTFHAINNSQFELKRAWMNSIIKIDNDHILEIKKFTRNGLVDIYEVETTKGRFYVPKDVDPGLMEKLIEQNSILLTTNELHG